MEPVGLVIKTRIFDYNFFRIVSKNTLGRLSTGAKRKVPLVQIIALLVSVD